MIRTNITILLLSILSCQLILVNCHGRLLVPPARTSAWREDPIKFTVNYDDNEMFCGGFNTQWLVNKGKCGICGESYSEKKSYEKGLIFSLKFSLKVKFKLNVVRWRHV